MHKQPIHKFDDERRQYVDVVFENTSRHRIDESDAHCLSDSGRTAATTSMTVNYDHGTARSVRDADHIDILVPKVGAAIGLLR